MSEMYNEKGNILLVEDEAIIAMNERVVLEDAGYSVEIAADGESAVMMAGAGFDLVLMDIDLGEGMDGTEAAKIIIDKYELPIVFLSSHTEPEIVLKTEGITSYGYIVKNTGATVLLASIRMAFRLCCAHDELSGRENELRWEKSRLKQYIDVAEVMLLVIGADRRVKLINPKGCKVLGGSEEDIIGKDWFRTFIPSGDSEKTEDVFSKIIGGDLENAEYYENDIICSDGTVKRIAWHNSLIEDQHGRITGVLCSGEDVTEARRYQAELSKSRDDFYQLFYGMSDAAVIYAADECGNDFFIADMNEAAQKITGVQREDVIGGKLTEEFTAAEEIGLLELVQKVSRTGEPGHLPIRHYLDDKRDVWVENFVFRLPSGYVVAVFRNQNLKVEQDRIKERLHIINELGADYSYCHRFTPDSSIEPVWHTGSFDEITGYTSEKLTEIGGWQNLIHPDDVQDAAGYIAELSSGKEASFTARIITKDGTMRWIEDRGRPWFDGDGRVIGAYGYAKEITEQKELADRLAESEEKYRALYLNAPLPYQSLDREGNFVDINPAWLGTLGYERDEVIGRNFADFLHPDWKSHFEVNFPEFKRRGSVHDVQFKIKRKDGSYIDISFEGCIGYNPDGTFRQTYCVFKDITAQVKAEEEKMLMLEELNHRVKNNLQMVSSLLKLKDSELGDSADLSDLIHQVESIRLIHHNLAGTGNISVVKLRKYLEELLVSVFDVSSGDKNIELKIDMNEIVLPTKTAVTLGLMVNEIATNAVKYGFRPDESSVFILEQKKPEDSSRLVVRVSNTGRKFPAELNFENSGGLGLKLVNMLAHQLGGTIELEKEPVTAFTISLPL